MRSDRDRCIALAGIFQAADLAARIARHGMADADAVGHSIYSLFQTDPDTTTSVYGGVAGIRHGLLSLLRQLDGGADRDMDTTRYVIALMHLERKLARKRPMLAEIAAGIETTAARLDHFPMTHPNILAGLAEIYSRTISTLQPRIMVRGEPTHLHNPDNVNRIRALLLAGIRAAMLWRQCGGGRLQLLLRRRRLATTARALLAEGGCAESAS
ncbi:MAG TPA: lysogenization regulator HflD [Sedimenticola thiotaurini]|uniref:High frequency lysogenization protein HflD homolog n=1 Tax=Sedimenticola thiotaurini TaxID=1543721 RepID=A0A831RJB5_9GAMM|nr:lysogenization regulator HflD [Sedimenticola thiotaurini]